MKAKEATATRALKFRTPWRRPRTAGITFHEATLTKQSFKDECDINNILKRFERTGQLPELIKQNPQYGEFADAPAYQDALNLVLHAQEQFDALSSKVRERFNNDPTKFLEFASNPQNGEEMVRLGLATKRERSNERDKSTPPADPQSPKNGESSPKTEKS